MRAEISCGPGSTSCAPSPEAVRRSSASCCFARRCLGTSHDSLAAADGLRVWAQPDPPEGWDALLAADHTSSPAHRTGVAGAFAAVVPGHRVEYLVAADAEGLAGGMAMCVQNVAGAEWLHAMPMMLPGAPLARPGRRDAVDAIIAEAFATRASQPSTVGGEWVGYRPGIPLAARHLECLPGETRQFTASLIDLAGEGVMRWQSDRRERKALRRAERAGLSCGEEPETLDEVYALHLSQSRRWSGHRPPQLALLRRLLSAVTPAEDALARLFTVRSARRLLAGMVVLDHSYEMLAWWSGTHRDARDMAASRALLVWAIEWAQARGRTRFNLGASAGIAGVSSFKQSLGARELAYPVRWLAPIHLSPTARVLAALQRRARRGRHLGEAV